MHIEQRLRGLISDKANVQFLNVTTFSSTETIPSMGHKSNYGYVGIYERYRGGNKGEPNMPAHISRDFCQAQLHIFNELNGRFSSKTKKFFMAEHSPSKIKYKNLLTLV